MTDVALVWNADEGSADFALAGGGLLLEEGLRTAVIVSLMTDGLARADDDLADGGVPDGDRRGWWGDVPVTGQTARSIGSRLWLLRRAKATEGTRLRALTMAREALAWLVTDGVAERVDVTGRWGGNPPDRLFLTVTITRGGAASIYDLQWTAEGLR
jgi:phage gp46-like protein